MWIDDNNSTVSLPGTMSNEATIQGDDEEQRNGWSTMVENV